LNELHMHLNGATEVDLIWSEAMRNPINFCRTLSRELKENHDGTVNELYDQLETGLRPTEFSYRLLAARQVRHIVADILCSSKHTPWRRRIVAVTLCSSKHTPWRPRSALFKALTDPFGGRELPLSHPPAEVIFGKRKFEPLINEAAFLYAWLQALKDPDSPRELLGLGLYFQLLVQVQVVALSVQQQDQIGFDQFQKFTHVGARGDLEEHYDPRFRQLNRAPPYKTLRHLEGRFAPKDNFYKLIALIEKILRGYLNFRGCPSARRVKRSGNLPGCVHGRCDCGGSIGRKDAELSLVVHFIKTKEGRHPHKLALHGTLRDRLMRQARGLVRALRLAGVREIVRGMDAAANEMHTPPEVFGPLFRFLRINGLERATYHAGEDYTHLVSGIRATEEALTFLPLHEGDRLGHATALGIDPSLWSERFRPRIIIECGEHLDNLVYAFSRLAGRESTSEAYQWQEVIARLAQKIYGREASPSVLELAWQMRQLDIMQILDLERREGLSPGNEAIVDAARRTARHTAGSARRAELHLIADKIEAHPISYWFARERHRKRGALAKLEEIDTNWISVSALTTLQADMLKRLAEHRVAIETLPTSNVRISFYRQFKEHHLFRWLGLSGEGFAIMPDVCIGSDDPGIFATSLHNEYALLFETLCRDFGQTPRNATVFLEQLNNNGFAHRFAPQSRA
jgi:adenosine deaminase